MQNGLAVLLKGDVHGTKLSASKKTHGNSRMESLTRTLHAELHVLLHSQMIEMAVSVNVGGPFL